MPVCACESQRWQRVHACASELTFARKSSFDVASSPSSAWGCTDIACASEVSFACASELRASPTNTTKKHDTSSRAQKHPTTRSSPNLSPASRKPHVFLRSTAPHCTGHHCEICTTSSTNVLCLLRQLFLSSAAETVSLLNSATHSTLCPQFFSLGCRKEQRIVSPQDLKNTRKKHEHILN